MHATELIKFPTERPQLCLPYKGPYSLTGKTFYRKISWSIEAARWDVIMFISIWNLTGTWTALVSGCLSNFRSIGKVLTRISRLRDFTRSCGKTSVHLVNRSPVRRNNVKCKYLCICMYQNSSSQNNNTWHTNRARLRLVLRFETSNFWSGPVRFYAFILITTVFYFWNFHWARQLFRLLVPERSSQQ